MRSISCGNKVMLINSNKKESAVWRVTDSMLKTVPDDYDVSRSSRFITGTDVSDICARLVRVFRKLSITAFYDEKKAKAKCVTKDFVKLQVRLFRGRDQAYSHGIIVEVIRRCGLRMEFAKDCNLILNAAEGKPNTKSGCFNNSPHMRQPVSSLQCLKDVFEPSEIIVGSEATTKVRTPLVKKEHRNVNLIHMNAAIISTSKSGAEGNSMRMNVAQIQINH